MLILVHGMGEHSGRYEHVGAWFARRGCAVHAYDQRGHGRSPGRRGHVERFADLIEDLASFVEQVSREHPHLPRSIIGHSMGGLVLLAFASEERPGIDRIVTSGAALSLPSEFSPIKMKLARLLRSLVPRLVLDSGLDAEGLSRDPVVVSDYLEDPLVDTRVTLSLALGLLESARRTQRAGRELRIPVLMLHGAADPLCLAAGSEAFFEDLPTGEIREASELHIYPELRHEIFNEPERESVFSDILAWIEGSEGRGERGAWPES
jgi:alpha-beta hydrolase superfamily lysophospholipase